MAVIASTGLVYRMTWRRQRRHDVDPVLFNLRHWIAAGMKQSFTLQPPGSTVDSFFIQSPCLNCLSILSAPYTFSNTVKSMSCWVWPFSPKWKLIGLSFLSRTSRRYSVIRSRNSLSVSPTYTVDRHLVHIMAYTTLRMWQVMSWTGL